MEDQILSKIGLKRDNITGFDVAHLVKRICELSPALSAL